jgi:hypothetical protein
MPLLGPAVDADPRRASPEAAPLSVEVIRMTDPRSRPDDRPNVGGTSLTDDIVSLQGDVAPVDQDAIMDVSEIETAPAPTMLEQPSGAFSMPDREFVADAQDPDIVTSLEAVTDSELRDGETDDPIVAIEEGLTYVPPSDPPVVASDDPEGIAVAAGFSTGAAEETWDLDHRTSEQVDESELNALIRAAIRADAATSQLADRVRIAVVGSTVVIRGTVDDLEDGDAIAAVVEQVEGVREVRDETEVAALG